MTTYTLHQGNNIDTLKNYPDNHFDSIVTDPPYGIEFLGKDWDSNTGAIETWQQCLRVLKPGGHLLAFSAARTYHHLATNIESVGFEIRDQIMWIYGSGFPKAQDVGKNIQKRMGVKEYEHRSTIDGYNLKNQKGFTENNDVGYGQMKPITKATDPEAQQWEGWKTALKPAHEPIVMARKPMKGSTVNNVLEHGVGALNIDATRVDVDPAELEKFQSEWNRESAGNACMGKLDGSEVDHVGIGKSVKEYMPTGRYPSNVMGEIPEYQKYFYCPKVNRAERHTGNADNNHPTVKPVALMRYLVTLITPPGGKVLDPFMGSGSTGMAVVEFGGEFTGCELDPDYVDIAERRISAWLDKHQPLSKYETDLTTTTDK